MKTWTAGHSFFHDADLTVEWLDRLMADGIAFVDGVRSVGKMAAQIGIIAETNYGRLFDVRAVPNAENLAYTDIGLGLHTDNPYRDPVPGYQALHAIRASRNGGDSLFADGFAIAEHLRDTDPESFAVLTSTPVCFAYRSADVDFSAERCLIESGITAIRYNNGSIVAKSDERFYGAYRAFALLSRDPKFVVQTRLENGQMVVFGNHRVLHGRTAFSSQTEERHLQGCYLSRDSVLSHWRVAHRGSGRLVSV